MPARVRLVAHQGNPFQGRQENQLWLRCRRGNWQTAPFTVRHTEPGLAVALVVVVSWVAAEEVGTIVISVISGDS